MLLFLLSTAICETHPKLTWQKCTSTGCTPVEGFIVADIGFRSSSTASVNYEDELGVHTEGMFLSQRLVSDYNGKRNVGSRLYLLDASEKAYQLFNLNGKEIAYDVDLSQITCGVDAALYTAQMGLTGGDNDAAYGGGYCDAGYSGGAGCPSFDLQEGNSRAMIFRAQPCDHRGWSKDGECASPGCGYNAYLLGLKDFWGRTINPRSKVTVVTQFVTAGSTLTEIRRIYIQGGKLYRNPSVKLPGDSREFSALSEEFCRATVSDWSAKEWRTLPKLGESFEQGHVLVFSLWDSSDMGWLDSGEYGPCDSPSKEEIEAEYPEMTVTWSNIRYGDIDTTY
jgi:hypothetical protein